MTLFPLVRFRFIALFLGPGKKPYFFMAKTVGSFSQNRDFPCFFPEHKNRRKRGNFTKSVIYRGQKSKKLPWHCVTGTFLDGCFKLTRFSFFSFLFFFSYYYYLCRTLMMALTAVHKVPEYTIKCGAD